MESFESHETPDVHQRRGVDWRGKTAGLQRAQLRDCEEQPRRQEEKQERVRS